MPELTSPASSALLDGHRPASRKSAATLVLIVIVLYAALLAGDPRTPKPFQGVSAGSYTWTGPVEVGVPMNFGFGHAALPDVTVTRASVRVEGEVPVATEVVVCRRQSPRSPTLGSDIGDLARECGGGVSEVSGADLGDLDEDDYLVVTAVALAPGAFTIEGVEVEFEAGRRSGKQLTGVTARLEAMYAPLRPID